jgi:hypothetical protein
VFAGDIRREDIPLDPVPPVITEHPSPQHVCLGTTATFTVAATGQGTLTYQWQKDSANLGDGGHYSGVTTTTLTVTGSDTADVASYRCVVTNTGGSTLSDVAGLTLKEATRITQHPAAQSICPGSATHFTVSASGEGAVTYRWQKNGSNLSNGGHYTGVTTATLTVSGASDADVADYRCVVTAGCGSATSNTAALTLRTVVAADFDADCDVDATDYELFEACASGPGIPVVAGCATADFDLDGDADQADFSLIERCVSGENVPSDPNCDL